MIHYLKTWPEQFRQVATGRKLHELRRADRPFTPGDTLCLQEFIPPRPDTVGGYTGREIDVEVLHITQGVEVPKDWGLAPECCIMSFKVLGVRKGEPWGEVKPDEVKRKEAPRFTRSSNVQAHVLYNGTGNSEHLPGLL
jgi:hypothetical protein